MRQPFRDPVVCAAAPGSHAYISEFAALEDPMRAIGEPFELVDATRSALPTGPYPRTAPLTTWSWPDGVTVHSNVRSCLRRGTRVDLVVNLRLGTFAELGSGSTSEQHPADTLEIFGRASAWAEAVVPMARHGLLRLQTTPPVTPSTTRSYLREPFVELARSDGKVFLRNSFTGRRYVLPAPAWAEVERLTDTRAAVREGTGAGGLLGSLAAAGLLRWTAEQ